MNGFVTKVRYPLVFLGSGLLAARAYAADTIESEVKLDGLRFGVQIQI